MLPSVITTSTSTTPTTSPAVPASSLLELTVPLVSIANANAVGKLLLEPKASSAIVFCASVLAFVCSIAHVPYAVVVMEAIGWSGLAHLVRSCAMEQQQRRNGNTNNNEQTDDITVSADAEDDHACVLAELRMLFRSSSTPLLLRY